MKCRDCKEFESKESVCGYVADVWLIMHIVTQEQECDIMLADNSKRAFRERSNTES